MVKERNIGFKIVLAIFDILCLAVIIFAEGKMIQYKSNKPIDLNKYVTVAGYEGYAYLTLDWDRIDKKYGHISRRFSDQIRCNCDEAIENGKTVHYSWVIADEVKSSINKQFIYEDGSLKVKSLEPPERFDAFDGVKLVLSGRDAEGIAELDCTEAPLHYFEYSVSPKEKLSNGDQVHVTIDEKRNAFIIKNVNKLPESYDKTFVVEGLE